MSEYYMYTQPGGQQIQPAMFRPAKAEDWEPYRDIIAHLYNTMKLKDVMTEMQVTYNFKATEKQYKTQIKKWNLDTKYIKASEYMFMIKTMREREATNPGKETRFILRGRVVDPKDIARFEKRAQKKGLIKDGDPVEIQGSTSRTTGVAHYRLTRDFLIEPVEDLVYGTPSPEPSGSMSNEMSYSYDPTLDYSYSY
ncbi:Clr5 domain-containing protein [Madurella fahalii]|uniref:Clr5 domain-containing protein n=1 Tax=Madurella fahalii TaxID=1157608 RepID=A0ABQ0GN11_9PEZI